VLDVAARLLHTYTPRMSVVTFHIGHVADTVSGCAYIWRICWRRRRSVLSFIDFPFDGPNPPNSASWRALNSGGHQPSPITCCHDRQNWRRVVYARFSTLALMHVIAMVRRRLYRVST